MIASSQKGLARFLKKARGTAWSWASLSLFRALYKLQCRFLRVVCSLPLIFFRILHAKFIDFLFFSSWNTSAQFFDQLESKIELCCAEHLDEAFVKWACDWSEAIEERRVSFRFEYLIWDIEKFCSSFLSSEFVWTFKHVRYFGRKYNL